MHVKTLQRHIAEQQRQHATATGEFSWLLSGITLATKAIAAQVRRIGLGDLRGAAGGESFQGETVLKMDRYADEVILECLGYRDQVSVMVSEENQQPVITKNVAEGKYVVLFDPLDGSSNLDCNVAVGTIFAIYGRRPGGGTPLDDVLQPGNRMLAAGYVLYSSSTVLAYTTGRGRAHVHPGSRDRGLPAVQRARGAAHHRQPHPQLQRGQRRELPRGDPALPGLDQDPRGRALRAAATSARWWPTSTARWSRAASSSTRPPPSSPRASCACSTSATPWPSWPNRRGARPATARDASWTGCPPTCTSARRSTWASRAEVETVLTLPLIPGRAGGSADAGLDLAARGRGPRPGCRRRRGRRDRLLGHRQQIPIAGRRRRPRGWRSPGTGWRGAGAPGRLRSGSSCDLLAGALGHHPHAGAGWSRAGRRGSAPGRRGRPGRACAGGCPGRWPPPAAGLAAWAGLEAVLVRAAQPIQLGDDHAQGLAVLPGQGAAARLR